MQTAIIILVLAMFLIKEPAVEAKVVALLSVPHIANVRTHTNVGRALTAMGHDAHVLIPQFMLTGKLVNIEGVKVIEYGDYLGDFEEVLTGKLQDSFWRGDFQMTLTNFLDVVKKVQETAHLILSDKLLQQKLQDIRPDLFVLTYVPPFKDIVILPYIFNSSFVYLSPFNDLHGNRVPISPSTTPCQLVGIASEPTFIDRLKTTACNTFLTILSLISGSDNLLAELVPHMSTVTVNELVRKAEVYLVEGDHILDYAKPELPNMKLIGCTAPIPGKPLQDHFKTFVENAENGVALVTFGSSVVNIPIKIAEVMAAAFEKQDLSIVWRVNYTSKNPKIFTSLWVPQNDILAHNKTKLFVSHCGANGQYEALYHGVPMLCFPLFGDQLYNARRSTAKGFGLEANILDITPAELSALMKELTDNDKYNNNIKKASTIFRQLYKEPAKTAAFWIDHVLEYGGSYMRSAGQDMPLYQFLVLDVLAFLALVMSLFIFVVYCTCRCFCCAWRKICGKQQTIRKNKWD